MNRIFTKIFEQFNKDSNTYKRKINSVKLKKKELVLYLQKELSSYRQWRKSYMFELGRLGKEMSPQERMIHRQMVLNSDVCKNYQDSPFCWRIVQRPEGYVGDAEMMEIIYRADFEGETPWGQIVHKEATNYAACQAVRNRKDFILEKIKNTNPNSKILSLAAGSAREMKEFVEYDTQSKSTFLALDHDINTIRRFTSPDDRITYGLANAFQLIKGNSKIAIPRKNYLSSANPKKDFKGLRKLLIGLRYKLKSLDNNEFDLVYSAGLFDYIQHFENNAKGTKGLTSFLFSKVKSGGKLVIGNFNCSIPSDEYFSMEFLTNWLLYYRDDNELLQFTEGVNDKEIKSIKIEKESTGINSFLIITKA